MAFFSRSQAQKTEFPAIGTPNGALAAGTSAPGGRPHESLERKL